MKKVMILIASLVMAISMAACSNAGPNGEKAIRNDRTAETKYVDQVTIEDVETEKTEETAKIKNAEEVKGLGDFLLGLLGLTDDVDTETTVVAPSMQKQVDQISNAVLEIPELEYENWKDLDTDERRDALQELETQVAVIACREEVFVLVEDLGYGTYGMYNTEGNTITIDDDLVESDSWTDYVETMDTFFHEGRHAYQFYNLYEAEVESNAKLVEAWRTNIDVLGYNSGDSGLFGYEEYYTQPIEVDARVFAEEVLMALELR